MTRKIDIEALCADKGLRITEQRKIVARVLGDSEDHPDVEILHARAAAIDPNISIATVYRTVRLFEEAGILERHEFGDGRSLYEAASESHHDHLIDVETGNVIEFVDDELEMLQKRIAEKLGFRLVDHRMELYGAPKTAIVKPAGARVNARAIGRIAAVILLFAVTAPVHLLCKLVLRRSPVPPWFLGAVTWLIGARIRVTGRRSAPQPAHLQPHQLDRHSHRRRRDQMRVRFEG